MEYTQRYPFVSCNYFGFLLFSLYDPLKVGDQEPFQWWVNGDSHIFNLIWLYIVLYLTLFSILFTSFLLPGCLVFTYHPRVPSSVIPVNSKFLSKGAWGTDLGFVLPLLVTFLSIVEFPTVLFEWTASFKLCVGLSGFKRFLEKFSCKGFWCS